jgi:hypothetical protein
MIRINKNAIVKAVAGALGFEVRKRGKYPKDIDRDAIQVCEQVAPYTMIGFERLFALVTAVRYLAQGGVPGAFVECGVWRGGATAATALTLKAAGAAPRDTYLYDTFEGMPRPGNEDRNFNNEDAAATFAEKRTADDRADWNVASLEDVRENFRRLGLEPGRFHFVKGMVEDTLPAQAPAGDIALLRLDTDWYKSTRHELLHLFPKLAPGGVLIIDDYGDWRGARKAVDEYLAETGRPMLLTRVNGSVVGVKR